jgi:hypothetical protein
MSGYDNFFCFIPDAFYYFNYNVLQGLLAYVGGGEALTQVQVGDVPIFSYAGSISFMLWRSVYLVKQVATRNRVLVTFDWVRFPTLVGCVMDWYSELHRHLLTFDCPLLPNRSKVPSLAVTLLVYNCSLIIRCIHSNIIDK